MKTAHSGLIGRIEGMVDPFVAYPPTAPDKRPTRFVLSHPGPFHPSRFRRVMIWAGFMSIAVAVL